MGSLKGKKGGWRERCVERRGVEVVERSVALQRNQVVGPLSAQERDWR